MKEEQRWPLMADEYQSLVKTFHRLGHVTDEGVNKLKELAGAHKVDRKTGEPVSDKDGWPTGQSLLGKFDVIKSKVRNYVLPYIPKEIKALDLLPTSIPSGHSFHEYVLEWQKEVYVRTEGSRKNHTNKLVRTMINDDAANIPNDYWYGTKYPLSVFLAAKVFMYSTVFATECRRYQQEAATPRAQMRAKERSIRDGSVAVSDDPTDIRGKPSDLDRKRKIQQYEAKTKRSNNMEWKKANTISEIRMFHEIGRHYLTDEQLSQRIQARFKALDYYNGPRADEIIECGKDDVVVVKKLSTKPSDVSTLGDENKSYKSNDSGDKSSRDNDDDSDSDN